MRPPMLAALSLIIVAASAQSDADVCYNNLAQCEAGLRQVLLDESKFFFGTTFDLLCPNGPSNDPTSICQNKLPGRRSILSRILERDSNLASVSAGISLARVTYSSPAHSYYACGHDFNQPATRVAVSPTEISRFPQSVAGYKPEVTWTARANTLYTVVVWAPTYGILHGVYINAQNSLSTGVEVYSYNGPVQSQPTPNPYVFIVVPQATALSPDAVNGVVQGIRAADIFFFSTAQFFAQLGFTDVQFSNMAFNLMNIVGDAYGAQSLKSAGAFNTCPLFVSQLSPLYSAFQRANVSAAWSNMFSGETSPYLTSLDSDISVMFSTDDIEFESCCKDYTYIRSLFIPDPYNTQTQYPVQVRNQPRVSISDIYPSSGFSFGGSFKSYTLMLVDFGDLSAPQSSPPVFVVHWLVTDISEKDVTSGKQVVPFFGSNPFSPGSGRMYTFLLLEQTTPIDTSSLIRYVQGSCGSFPQRCRYQVGRLLREWGLNDVRAVTWYLAEQDAFARMRIYNTWAVRDRDAVCTGVEGYSNPFACSMRSVYAYFRSRS